MDVLLLEDEVNTREFFTMLLHDIPGVTTVMNTSSGMEAINLARYNHPDLILLDIELINDDFIRVHRSFIVNIKHIKNVQQVYDRTYDIELRDYSKKIPMSRNAYSKYKYLFN